MVVGKPEPILMMLYENEPTFEISREIVLLLRMNGYVNHGINYGTPINRMVARVWRI